MSAGGAPAGLPSGGQPAELRAESPGPLAQLASFYAALAALRSGHRERPVRVLWLGDSHTAADFMTHRVRLALQRRGGDGGPGFVRVGLKGYGQGAAVVESTGRWRHAPLLPAQRTRVLDGVFGYGGVRAIPVAGATARVRARAPAGTDAAALAPPGAEEGAGASLSWSLSYRLGPGGALDVQLGGERRRLAAASAAASAPETITFSAPEASALTVSHVAGSPEVFGVVVERGLPGVVLDTVGINGARAATVLAWEPEQYVAAVAARAPDLLVLAFGTNEVFDKTRAASVRGHLEQIVTLARRAAPSVACWIVGPPDARAEGGGSRPRVLEISSAQAEAAAALGCAFTSSFELMGGEGAYARWQLERPPLAAADGIHLTIAGYRELGERLAAALLGGAEAAPPP